MREASSAFYALCQEDHVNIAELIEFSTRTYTWRWTTSNQDIVSSGYTFEPFPGQAGGGIEEGIDLRIATIDFTLQNSGGTFDAVLGANDLDMAGITVRRVHVSTPDAGSIEIYRGKVGDYVFDRKQINGQARNFFNSINVQWPYYTYMDQCAWRFGSVGCGFNTASITVSSTAYPVSSGDRLNVYANIASVSNNFYDKGRLTFVSGANSGHARSVRYQTGNLLALSHSLPYAVSSGDQFQLYPGCSKRIVDDCTSKYNNVRNALAFPWIPKQESAFA